MSLHIPSSEWRLATAGGIPYKVVERSGDFSAEDATGREVYIIEASRLTDFARESFPASYETPTGVVYLGNRSMPEARPLRSRRFSWEAWDASLPCDPFGADALADTSTYCQYLRVTIEYGTSVNNDDDPDPADPKTYLEISANASGEYLSSQATGTAVWVPVQTSDPDADAPVEGAGELVNDPAITPVFTQPEIEWTVRWTQIPFAFFNGTVLTRLRSKLGKVNSSAMSLMYNAPLETVLFMGWSMSQQLTWRTGRANQPPIQLELKFLEKNFLAQDGVQVTHNHILRPGKGYRKVKIDGTNYIYASTNLDQIFTV